MMLEDETLIIAENREPGLTWFSNEGICDYYLITPEGESLWLCSDEE